MKPQFSELTIKIFAIYVHSSYVCFLFVPLCLIALSPQLEYIDVIEAGLTNTGHYIIAPQNYANRNNINNDLQFGFLQINLTDPQQYNGLQISP